MSQSRIEVRAIRAQDSSEKIELITELFNSRIQYLKTIKEPLVYHNGGAIKSYQQGIDQFYLYLTQSGLPWEKYKKLLPMLTWRWRKPSKKVKELAALPDSYKFEEKYKDVVFKYNSKNYLPFWMTCSLFLANR
ncbi:MAG: hypothetical protein H6621_04225 [Halobacteriovoraceae bacterium]|nr:hypothetical protein [Halobacteriovoraceae bacterium]